MKITNVNFYEEITKPFGLSKIEMPKLGDIVLLAGENGSGKTRLLSLIAQYSKGIKEYKKKRKDASEKSKVFKEHLKSYLSKLKDIDSSKIEEVNNIKAQITRFKTNYEKEKLLLDNPLPIMTDVDQEILNIVSFVPKKIDLEDWANLPKNKWIEKADKSRLLGMSHLHESTTPIIQQILSRYFNATHPNTNYSEEESKEAINNYKNLQKIIKQFMKTQLEFDIDGNATIFSKKISDAYLSNGQKILLQLCIAIYGQANILSDYIILMDEPENHLHPSIVIDFIDSIREHNPSGQIWIATHSIPILSYFDSASLWFVKNGSIKYSGKTPELVLETLIGNENRREKLRSFTNLPHELAINRFAFKCLCSPKAVETTSSDPQSVQLNNLLKLIWKDKSSINLLDFGAGKGRMIANLSDYENISVDSLNYHAYDLFDDDRENCINNISRSYDDSSSRYHNSIDDILNTFGDKYFDVVVLSNVLHEIEYEVWEEIFNDIFKLLNKNGYLLIIEDCLIPVGELPHKKGFIIFNTLHIKNLFEIPERENNFIVHDACGDKDDKKGRLMAHLIPAKYLEKVSSQTIKKALTELRKTSELEIIKIRSLDSSDSEYSNGLLHSFWVQQLANTTLCLTDIEENKKT